MTDGPIVITGKENIAAVRLLALKGMMKLQLMGLKHSSGSIIAKVKREFGFKGSNKSVYEQFLKMLDERGIKYIR